ncbi:hypothetical protein EDEG_03268 [Edhazardia aedis USNM 41457]|uniref:Uncharacterized protein n=1 Tax=Edhazardia aedis (strain USNM 41457) TaxID=1003232 RepID=J9DI42_EDHAE|nr:hypothetical protein EDEG_03268 [Edhazardia aedis USNM 41457]|eukprot:EJW02295.1 hypothetical protein EDEG_03268 [Edhazardia aedis USNM 41457]
MYYVILLGMTVSVKCYLGKYKEVLDELKDISGPICFKANLKDIDSDKRSIKDKDIARSKAKEDNKEKRIQILRDRISELEKQDESKRRNKHGNERPRFPNEISPKRNISLLEEDIEDLGKPNSHRSLKSKNRKRKHKGGNRNLNSNLAPNDPTDRKTHKKIKITDKVRTRTRPVSAYKSKGPHNKGNSIGGEGSYPGQTRPNYNGGSSTRPNYNDNPEDTRPPYDDALTPPDDQGEENDYTNDDENTDSALPPHSGETGSDGSYEWEYDSQDPENEYGDENLEDDTVGPEDFDWNPIVKKVVIPAEPRRVCIVKIVPVPVTKDGTPWNANKC